MSKRTLPCLPTVQAREGVAFDIHKRAAARWQPELRAATDDATITIYDVIGKDEFGGVSEKRVANALRAIGPRDVTVKINSPGGDFYVGIAIYNLLREHPFNVTVKVIGQASSAASIIAMAGDRIEIGRAAFLFIHNVWTISIGNRHDFREVADSLDPIDAALAEVYAMRSGNETETVSEMMDKETEFSGAHAVENGFADALLPADEIEEGEARNETDTSPAAVVRRVDAALLKGGVRREERRSLMDGLRNAVGSHSFSKESNMTTKTEQELRAEIETKVRAEIEEKQKADDKQKAKDKADEKAAQPADDKGKAKPSDDTGTANASAIADAIKADRKRSADIMALDEAKGRHKLAQTLADQGLNAEQAKTILAASPKANALNDAMEAFGSPGIESQEETDAPQNKISSASDIYAARAKIFNGAARGTSRW